MYIDVKYRIEKNCSLNHVASNLQDSLKLKIGITKIVIMPSKKPWKSIGTENEWEIRKWRRKWKLKRFCAA